MGFPIVHHFDLFFWVILKSTKHNSRGIEMKMKKKDIALHSSERTKCEVWSRVMGYFRPVQSWNRGKKSEYGDRVNYLEPSQLNEKVNCQEAVELIVN